MTLSAANNSRKRQVSPHVDCSHTLPPPKAARLMDDVDISKSQVTTGIGIGGDATGDTTGTGTNEDATGDATGDQTVEDVTSTGTGDVVTGEATINHAVVDTTSHAIIYQTVVDATGTGTSGNAARDQTVEDATGTGTGGDVTGDTTGNQAVVDKVEDKGDRAIVDKVIGSSSADHEGFSQIKEYIGDLFAAPNDSVLIHACNTAGSWGGGIAVAFRERYPEAYQLYNEYCTKHYNVKTNPVPTGTCLLIPPVETEPGALKHWIACLFTSAKYGKAKDPPYMILQHTGPAFKDLLIQLKVQPTMEQLRMCKINAGLFAVPWEETKKEVGKVLATDAPQALLQVYTPAYLPATRTSAKVPAKKAGVKKQSSAKGAPPKTQTASNGQSSLHSYF